MIEFLILFATVFLFCLFLSIQKSWKDSVPPIPIIMGSDIPQGIQIMTKPEFERFKKKLIKQYREGKR